MATYRLVCGLEEALESSDDERLAQWNDMVEKLLVASPEEQLKEKLHGESDIETDFADHLSRSESVLLASKRLIRRLFQCLQGGRDMPVDDDCSVEEPARCILDALTDNFDDATPQTTFDISVFQTLRACKNWMRWYLQIYEAHYGCRDGIHDFKSNQMLQIYLLMVDSLDDGGAQAASQMLFYATYCPIVGSDTKLHASFETLLEAGILDRLLKRLQRATSVPLMLSVVRNVHNIVASFDAGATFVTATISDVPDNQSTAPWARRDRTTTTFQQSMTDMIVWAVNESQFPGEKDDRRGELVVEILRCFYALRVSTDLMVPSRSQDLVDAIVNVLQLNLTDERSYECVLATLPLLMDANASFSACLLHRDTISALLCVLEKQMDSVLSVTRIDDLAVATLTPILAVLYKFGRSNDVFRSHFKTCIFPSSRESDFQTLVAEEQKENVADGKARNMTPLDAPPDSVRGKLVRFLTWPNSSVKRLAGELLWVLCDGDSNEFIHRVGLGNGLPILNLKGVVSLPSQLTGQP